MPNTNRPQSAAEQRAYSKRPQSEPRYEITRSDGTVVAVPHSAGASAAWAECNRVHNGVYAARMDFVARNGRRVECMSFPAALRGQS